MQTQTIPNATIADIEAALVEQYGRTYLEQVTRSDTRGEWTYRVSSKSQAKCVATTTSGGVTMSVSPHSSTGVKIVLGIFICIGLLALIFPGLILIGWTIARHFIVSAILKSRFPALTESVSKQAQARLGK